jgi:hypothetical protein
MLNYEERKQTEGIINELFKITILSIILTISIIMLVSISMAAEEPKNVLELVNDNTRYSDIRELDPGYSEEQFITDYIESGKVGYVVALSIIDRTGKLPEGYLELASSDVFLKHHLEPVLRLSAQEFIDSDITLGELKIKGIPLGIKLDQTIRHCIKK